MELNLEMMAPGEVLAARCPNEAPYLEFRGLLAKSRLQTAIAVYRQRTGSNRQVAEDTVNLMRGQARLSGAPRLSAPTGSTDDGDAWQA